MDFLNVLATTAPVSSIATAQSGGVQSKNVASFQNQLTYFVGQSNTEVASDVAGKPMFGLVPAVPVEVAAVDVEWNSDELQLVLDDLLDRLNELFRHDFNQEQLDALLPHMEQLAALLQLLGVPQNDSSVQLITKDELQALPIQQQQVQVITKLQDQLLQLQQNVEQGKLKQLQGLQPESIISSQLQKLSQVVKEAEQHTNKATGFNVGSTHSLFVEQGKGQMDAMTHLQRISESSTYQVAPKVTSELVTTATANEQTQNIELNYVKADGVKDFTPLISKAASTSSYMVTEDFAEKIKGMIVQKFNINHLNGVTEAKLQLTPEHLGKVDVKISMQNGIMTAIFQAETAMGKDALENQMAQLRASLASQGITVDKIEVSQASFATQLSQQQKQQQQFSNGQQNSKEEKQELDFDEELVGKVASRELGFGRSVNEVI